MSVIIKLFDSTGQLTQEFIATSGDEVCIYASGTVVRRKIITNNYSLNKSAKQRIIPPASRVVNAGRPYNRKPRTIAIFNSEIKTKAVDIFTSIYYAPNSRITLHDCSVETIEKLKEDFSLTALPSPYTVIKWHYGR